MNNYTHKHFEKSMPNKHLGLDIVLSEYWKLGDTFIEHWHEDLQLFYFISGECIFKFNNESYRFSSGDIAVVNNHELHYLKSTSDNFRFYLIRIDLPFLYSNKVDLCQSKYLSPLYDQSILFENNIRDDFRIEDCIKSLITEYFKKDLGYELSIKSELYKLLVLLLRGHVTKIYPKKKQKNIDSKLSNLDEIFSYIENNYSSHIDGRTLAKMSNLSIYYFYHLFKELTGKSLTEYVNEFRLKKSTNLLKSQEFTITEIALDCGFNDINYFSRLFKKKYGISPSKFSSSNKF